MKSFIYKFDYNIIIVLHLKLILKFKEG